MIQTLIAAAVTFVLLLIGVPIVLGLARLLGLYVVVEEKRSHVYVLFGKIVGTIDEPGLHVLPAVMGWHAFVVNWLGRCYVLDMRLDQEYLRSQPVNS